MSKKKTQKKHKKPIISRKPTLVFSLLVLAGFFAVFFGSVHFFRLSTTVHVLGVSSVLPANTEAELSDEQYQQAIEEKKRKLQALEEEELRLKQAKLDVMKKELEIDDETLVDCVGPDEKHFTTTYKSCYTLNKEWKNEDFSFTPLTKSTVVSEKRKSPEKNTQTENAWKKREEARNAALREKQALLERREQEEKEKMEKKRALQQQQLIDDGEINSQAELQEELKLWEEEQNKVVVETSTNSRLIKHKNTKAESIFPVFVDEETNELTITTPSGAKTVTVLPEKAVENILQAHKLTNVETELSSESGDMTQKLLLTEMDDEPVFAVKGVLEKKVLGIIPVAFSKTVYVSGEDGEILKTDQSVLNTILEAISF